MSNNRIVFEGLDELKDALRALPAELTAEASRIVLEAAEAAKAEIIAAYPERSGNLKRGVIVKASAAGRYGTGALIQNRAKHAYIFEMGTQARHTDLGANRGSMPVGNIFIPIVARWRRRMYERLKELVASKGLEVEGDAG